MNTALRLSASIISCASPMGQIQWCSQTSWRRITYPKSGPGCAGANTASCLTHFTSSLLRTSTGNLPNRSWTRAGFPPTTCQWVARPTDCSWLTTHGAEIMNSSITLARAAGLLIAMLALDAAATYASAQYRYRYGSGVYGYGPPVYGYSYGPAYYGYGPRYYGY